MARSMISRSLIALALLVAMALPGVAVAGDKARARELYNEGTRLYDVGEFRQALDSFKKGYLTYEEPAFLFNMAQCYRQLGEKAEAIRTYRSYLRRMTDAPNRAEVLRVVEALEKDIAAEGATKRREPQGVIEPKTPPKAEPEPEPAATTPTTTPTTIPTPSVSPQPAPTTSTTAVTTTTAAVTSTAAPASKPVYKRWWFWTIIGGVAVVGLGVGLGVGLSQSSSGPTVFPQINF